MSQSGPEFVFKIQKKKEWVVEVLILPMSTQK